MSLRIDLRKIKVMSSIPDHSEITLVLALIHPVFQKLSLKIQLADLVDLGDSDDPHAPHGGHAAAAAAAPATAMASAAMSPRPAAPRRKAVSFHSNTGLPPCKKITTACWFASSAVPPGTPGAQFPAGRVPVPRSIPSGPGRAGPTGLFDQTPLARVPQRYRRERRGRVVRVTQVLFSTVPYFSLLNMTHSESSAYEAIHYRISNVVCIRNNLLFLRNEE
ncbi:50S ribosomal protein L3 [Frankliniella fusca]|uniref:50S ribosomal protein L3 n=1 Tax=Frankliniella fusca TaxID=407009 RepID=A0AAE1LQ89_9NEOP|nr:50S ribosomal protein L3 [Frankliniella fusca]